MNYQWILFDADDTLFHFDAFQGLKLTFAQFDVCFTEQDYLQYQNINKPLWQAYQNGQIGAAQIKIDRFQWWADKLKISPEQLNHQFLQCMADICTLMPKAREMIESLGLKVKMGIITNGFTDLQLIRLQRCGLAETFFPLVISEQVGFAKPNVGIFEHAFALMDHPPKHRILMVGDNPHSDILGGLNAGIHTCWFNSTNQAPASGIIPHYQINCLTQLNAVVSPRSDQ